MLVADMVTVATRTHCGPMPAPPGKDDPPNSLIRPLPAVPVVNKFKMLPKPMFVTDAAEMGTVTSAYTEVKPVLMSPMSLAQNSRY